MFKTARKLESRVDWSGVGLGSCGLFELLGYESTIMRLCLPTVDPSIPLKTGSGCEIHWRIVQDQSADIEAEALGAELTAVNNQEEVVKAGRLFRVSVFRAAPRSYPDCSRGCSGRPPCVRLLMVRKSGWSLACLIV